MKLFSVGRHYLPGNQSEAGLHFSVQFCLNNVCVPDSPNGTNNNDISANGTNLTNH